MSVDTNVRKILIATDFSATARSAARWASTLARGHGARLELLHVLQSPPIALAPEIVPMPAEFHERERASARSLLGEEAAALRQEGLEVEATLRSGIAPDLIVAEAASGNADLVVIGTRGTSVIERLFLGSVAAHVVRDARCPVLAVPSEPVGAHRPIHRVLLPTDFSEDAARALAAARRILGPASAEKKVLLLHVWTVPMGGGVGWPAAGVEPDLGPFIEGARRQLEEVAQGLREAGYEVEAHECEGEPAHVIDREAREHGVDLIAMGTHGRSGLKRLFFGSVAERVLPAAPCPVLTVRQNDDDG